MAGPYAPGFHPHLPGYKHKFLATALGATMWFWIFYRARKDGAKLLGLRHPWEGHGHGHDAHDAHGHQEHH
ncbi:uncharacterized protein FIBRA_08452 [Fibroporia radiculosa]|uniref:NADH dehydrogenase [ubiquinone] 1 beta subcomplex subunit 2 n=1 Tax=Fibroporia radiculosa TaxID=599839 RepID=J4GHF8_9APHY|nr:uncharacterized protein FIBRA_08452 [Fibroporia radiculosa]CCM06208.1 predicted protein [Fibroporia radiculosa]